jgi:nucleoside-diphosphate-sugar epimerase
MTILVVGATGATGRLVVEQLLKNKQNVRIIVRSPEKIPGHLRGNNLLSITTANLLDLGDEELKKQLNGCDAVVSCLGHNISFKGIYGKPRRLVTDATKRLCHAIIALSPEKPVKYVLMNTSGNSNRDLREKVSFGQKVVIGMLRVLLPPHVDNEKAADFLRTRIGQKHDSIEWTAVRPDGLTHEDKVTKYDTYPSPIRSALFNAGKTSRINVAHFMTDLIMNDNLWKRWKGKMPVIYNTEPKETS